ADCRHVSVSGRRRHVSVSGGGGKAWVAGGGTCRGGGGKVWVAVLCRHRCRRTQFRAAPATPPRV
ncbi:MAG TPA: hypothetical protein PKD61_21960, partial [Polyangiaceae bacterium]|nr:hypothetical protein [Polyangiaceae bacterium]